MDDFFREWTTDNITIESIINLGRQFGNTEKYSFLDDFANSLQNSNYGEETKYSCMHHIIFQAGLITSGIFHNEFLDYYANTYKPEESNHDSVEFKLLKLKMVSEGYLVNACDSLIMKIAENPADDSGILSIRIKYMANEGILRLEVDDTGKGIDVKTEKKLFSDKMRSSKTAYSNKYGAYVGGAEGVALNMNRDILKEMWGKVGYVNKGINKGATFWYEAPIDFDKYFEKLFPDKS